MTANPTQTMPMALVAASTDDLSELLIWGTIALLVLVAFAIGVFILRRRILPSTSALKDPAWTLQELNDLRAEGRLTDAEYRALKRRVVESLANTDP